MTETTATTATTETTETTRQDLLGRALAQAAAKQLDEEFDLERWAQETFNDEPFTKLVAMVGLGAALIYKVEAPHNPGFKNYWDALYYVATSLSVGYGDNHPVTPMGKAIASVIQTIGPAMANRAYDGSLRAREKPAEEQKQIQLELLATMKEILAELKKKQG
jgi:hypothetical protein